MNEVTSFWDSVISAGDFTSFVQSMKDLVIILVPAVILPLCILKKGVGFVKGMLYTA